MKEEAMILTVIISLVGGLIAGIIGHLLHATTLQIVLLNICGYMTGIAVWVLNGGKS